MLQRSRAQNCDSAVEAISARAAALHGGPFDTSTGSRAMDRLLKIGNVLPATVRTAAYSMAALMEGALRRQATALDAGRTASRSPPDSGIGYLHCRVRLPAS